MGSVQTHGVVLGDDLQSALPAPPSVARAIENQGIDHGGRVAERLDPVPQRFVLQQREVVRGVVCDDRDAGIQQGPQRRDDLADDVLGRTTPSPRLCGADAVDGRRARWDRSMPVTVCVASDTGARRTDERCARRLDV